MGKNNLILKTLINIIFFCVLAIFLLNKINLSDFYNAILSFSTSDLLIIFINFAIFIFLSCLRFFNNSKIFIKKNIFNLSFYTKIISRSILISCIMPTGAAFADIYKYHTLKKINHSTRHSIILSILFDRLIGIFCILLLSAIMIFFIDGHMFKINKYLFIYELYNYLLIIILVIFVIFCVSKKNYFEKFKILKIYIPKIINKISFSILFISCIMHTVTSINIFIIFLNFNLDINLVTIIYMNSFIILLSLLPISFGGFGSREFGFLIIFNYLGNFDERLIIYSSICYGIFYFLTSCIFVIFDTFWSRVSNNN